MEVGVDGPHVRLAVEVDEELAGQGMAPHQSSRPLVEPQDGSSGDRQAHEEAEGRGRNERRHPNPPGAHAPLRRPGCQGGVRPLGALLSGIMWIRHASRRPLVPRHIEDGRDPCQAMRPSAVDREPADRLA